MKKISKTSKSLLAIAVILSLNTLVLQAAEIIPEASKGSLPGYLSDPVFYIFGLIVIVLLSTIAALAHALYRMPFKKTTAENINN